MNTNWMDKCGVIEDLYRIKHFDPIEKSIDIPLTWFDTIRNCITNAKEIGQKYVDIRTVVETLLQGKMSVTTLDNICAGIFDKYTNKCIYMNRLYTEWRVTDLFSSMVCCFQLAVYIERIWTDKYRANGIRSYLLNGRTCVTNIYTNDSNVVLDPTKRYHGMPIQKDMDFDNPNYFGLSVTNVTINNSFDICLLVEQNDELFEIILPLARYKVLIEEGLKIGDEDYDVLSITFADFELDFSINE